MDGPIEASKLPDSSKDDSIAASDRKAKAGRRKGSPKVSIVATPQKSVGASLIGCRFSAAHSMCLYRSLFETIDRGIEP